MATRGTAIGMLPMLMMVVPGAHVTPSRADRSASLLLPLDPGLVACLGEDPSEASVDER